MHSLPVVNVGLSNVSFSLSFLFLSVFVSVDSQGNTPVKPVLHTLPVIPPVMKPIHCIRPRRMLLDSDEDPNNNPIGRIHDEEVDFFS